MKIKGMLFFLVILIQCFLADASHQAVLVHNTLQEIDACKGKLHLRLQRVWGGDEEEDENKFFITPSSIVIDDNKLIYISDTHGQCIKVFDFSGKYLRTIGRKGRGPGDVYGPDCLDISTKGDLVVNEMGGRRIQWFSSEGKSKGIIKSKYAYRWLAVTSKDEIMVYGSYATFLSKKLVTVYNRKGKVLREIGRYHDKSKGYLESEKLRFTMDDSDNIYAANICTPVIRKYSPDGKLLMIITFDTPFEIPVKIFLNSMGNEIEREDEGENQEGFKIRKNREGIAIQEVEKKQREKVWLFRGLGIDSQKRIYIVIPERHLTKKEMMATAISGNADMLNRERVDYDIIDEYEKNNIGRPKSIYKQTYQVSDLKESIETIENARREHGLFSSFRPEKVAFGIRSAADVKKLHRTGLNQILLEITNHCNLKCAYCSASGKYANPGNSPGNMNWETCRKSVDFFFDRRYDSQNCFISFYGGEPLIRFDFMKEAVEYVKKEHGGNEYRFNLTTNGTLLNKEIADFFIENNFSVLVSLDGPQKINDRYRRFKNGKGTFNHIMKNLEFLKAYNMDYFSRKVSITSVLVPPFETIDEILDFFYNSKTLSEIKNKIRSSLVSTRGTSFLKDFDLEGSANEFPTIEEKFIERLKKAILDNNLNHLTIEKQNVYSIICSLARRPITKLYDHVYPLGACHIGLRRVFVKTTGDFYICEKGEKYYNIGCIDNGFDYDRIAYYYRKFEEALEDCRYCWALNHCERCWAAIGNLEEFTGKRKEQFCSYSKKIIEKAFKVYTQLLRENPDCLKVFKDVLIA